MWLAPWLMMIDQVYLIPHPDYDHIMFTNDDHKSHMGYVITNSCHKMIRNLLQTITLATSNKPWWLSATVMKNWEATDTRRGMGRHGVKETSWGDHGGKLSRRTDGGRLPLVGVSHSSKRCDWLRWLVIVRLFVIMFVIRCTSRS